VERVFQPRKAPGASSGELEPGFVGP
jgi:hypothetical protein